MFTDTNGDRFCAVCGHYVWKSMAQTGGQSSIVSAHSLPSEYQYRGVYKLLYKVQHPERV